MTWQQTLILLLLFLSFSVGANASAVLRSISFQPGITDSRITFTLSEKTTGRVKYLASPHRLIVEFADTAKRFNLNNVRLAGSNIISVNTEISSENLRFIFLVRGKVKWTTNFSVVKDGAVLELHIISPAKINSSQRPKTTTIFTQQNLLNTFSSYVNEKELPTNKLPKSITMNTPYVFTIVVDAGHGGKDPGAIGANGQLEKNVVLAISKHLVKQLNQHPNIHAILTRDGDYFVSLRERLKLARKSNADLFIAIHADAYFEKNAKGASVYALSHRGATSEAARWLAKQENYSELGDLELNTLQDRSLMLRQVLIDLAQTTTIQDSLHLGNKMLDVLDRVSTLHRRKVEQAPFVVLKSPDIPSILIETGFITNPNEEKRLSNPYYQEKIAQALTHGIKSYVATYGVLRVGGGKNMPLSSTSFPFIVRHNLLAAKANDTAYSQTNTTLS